MYNQAADKVGEKRKEDTGKKEILYSFLLFTMRNTINATTKKHISMPLHTPALKISPISSQFVSENSSVQIIRMDERYFCIGDFLIAYYSKYVPLPFTSVVVKLCSRLGKKINSGCV